MLRGNPCPFIVGNTVTTSAAAPVAKGVNDSEHVTEGRVGGKWNGPQNIRSQENAKRVATRDTSSQTEILGGFWCSGLSLNSA